MSEDFLSPFQIRNLRSTNNDPDTQDSVVRITAPGYNSTISSNPEATLRYRDEEGDKITIGSSEELIDRLHEPIPRPRRGSSQKKKDPMSIAMLLQQSPETLKYHTFDIDEREEIQKLWQEVQKQNKNLPPVPAASDKEELRIKVARGMLRMNKDSKSPGASDKPDDQRSISGRYHHNIVDSPHYTLNSALRNRLAVAYNRLKQDFWSQVANETGLLSEQAEYLHWLMGDDEMTRRAKDLELMETKVPANACSAKSSDEDRLDNHESSSAKVTHFDDYRALHFDATMPPRTRLPLPVGQPAIGNHTGFFTKRGVGKLHGAHVAQPPDVTASTANLTTEGKRQAQAAGDILRARTASTRHRKITMSPTDNTSHQNRWANYKATNFSSSSMPYAAEPRGCKALRSTFEGVRQAQAAGDKIRSRTNPVRHSRSSRSGSLDCISKNRWSSYAGSRTVRLDERRDVEVEPKEKLEPETIHPAQQQQQPSLLEVFEAELAKKDLNGNGDAEFPDPEISAIPPPSSRSLSSSEDRSDPAASSETISQPSNIILDGVNLIGTHLQGLAVGEEAQELSKIVDQGVRTAAESFEFLMRGIAVDRQQTLERPQAADTRPADSQGINETINGLRDFVVGLASGLDLPEQSASPEQPQPKKIIDPNIEKTPDVVDKEQSLSSATKYTEGLDTGIGPTSTNPESCATTSKNGQAPLDMKTTVHGADAISDSHKDTKLDLPSANIVERPSFDFRPHPVHHPGLPNGPRYHRPGPIHLSSNTTLARPSTSTESQIPYASPGYVDHMRRCHSGENVVQPGKSSSASPPPAATRFPSLAQFETQHTTISPSFPALPSMEPLVPQRVAGQSNSIGSRPEPSTASVDAASTLRDNGFDPSNLSNTQFPSFSQQDVAAQQKNLGIPAQNIVQNVRPRLSQDILPHTLQEQDHNLNHMLVQDTHRSHPAFADPRDRTAFDHNTVNMPRSWRTSPDSWQRLPTRARPSPAAAARLAEPFDPLDVEPSARPHLTEGIRRNATVAGTDSRLNARRRRPYSEAFDGNGRIAWDSFLPDSNSMDRSPPQHDRYARRHEHIRRGRERYQKRQEQLRRSATQYGATQRLTSPFRRYDDEHQDSATVSRINACVENLINLGYEIGEDGSPDRLVVYAQAADGDLVEAIDMIDEEQRAYRERN